MKDYSQIIARMKDSLWLIEKSSLSMIVDIVNRRLSGDPLDEEEIRLRIESADNGNRDYSDRVEIGGGIGILPIYGPIFPKSNLMTELSGATSLETFRNDLTSLLENDKVKSIVLDMDTPGGVSEMVEETGLAIRAARDIKPVYAVANTQCCSAGYWLASQATKFYSTLSGEVGSIGVCTIHEDTSERDKSEGRKITVLTAGELKAAGNPHEPLTQEARQYIQGRIDDLYGKFINAVAVGRNIDASVVRTEHAEGRVFSADRALEAGMIDGVRTLDSVVDELIADSHAPAVRSTLSRAMMEHHAAVPRLEHADMEHSEPGTGSPPERRSDGDIDPSEMYRREQVPPAFEEPEEEITNKGVTMDLLQKLREKLALSENANEDEILAVVTSRVNLSSELASKLGLEDSSPEALIASVDRLNSELKPLREADAQAKERRAFRETYPDEYARMQKLEATDRDNKAIAFAGNYNRFAIVKDGNVTDERSTRGFSSLVLADIEAAHKSVVMGDFDVEGLEKLLDHIANNGIVEYSEKGSARTKEGDTSRETLSNPRQEFATRVRETMEEDGLEREAAIKLVAENDPELYEAYRTPLVSENSNS